MNRTIRDQTSVGVLFVCLGNICRSPSSEGVFRHKAAQNSHGADIRIDSAGTGSYHIGQPPDQRAILSAAKRGVKINDLRARQVIPADFDLFDYIVAMDRFNYQDLVAMAPDDYSGRICMFMDFAPGWSEQEVPDPYYGGRGGFERVLDMIEDAAEGLLNDISQRNPENRN